LHLIATLAAIAVIAGAGTTTAAPVRSDLPLWLGGGDNVWPQSMSSKNEIGFTSIVKVGDWRLRNLRCEPADSDDKDCFTWLRLDFLSVIDGGFTVAEARTRAGLGDSISQPALFIALPELDAPDGTKVFVLQIGFRGGSRYLLLKGHGKPAYKQFEVLSADCSGDDPPSGFRQRKAPHGSFFLTDYCVVENQEGLKNLAVKSLSGKSESAMEFIQPADTAP
jgi:hypothetical protein